MKVLSLFDGISGAKVALNKCKIKNQYLCSEIDKFAIDVSSYHHSDIIRLGDVQQINFKLIGKIDLLIGGPPCQDLSIAKLNRSGLKGSRSNLFNFYLKALNECQPKYFIMENVASMKENDCEQVSKKLGIVPIMINSSLLTAQLRKRYYWCNFPVTQPKDQNIHLQSILENGTTDRKKSYCIDASYHKGPTSNPYYKSGRRQMVFDTQMQYRMLTPIECERLQGYPDNYTKTGLLYSISNTQRYKMLGNSFTLPVIEHILRGIQ